MRRAWILGVIDAMSKARNLLFPGQLRTDCVVNLTVADLVPISSSSFMTSLFAPPCNGPLRVPMAATIAEYTSVSVAAATRAANVDALSS